MKPTFNQGAAAVIIGIILCIMYFNQDARATFMPCLLIPMTYLFGSTAGSHAKDAAAADMNNQMVDALKNSQPAGDKTLTVEQTTNVNP